MRVNMRLGIRDALDALRLARVSGPRPATADRRLQRPLREKHFCEPVLERAFAKEMDPRVKPAGDGASACIASRRALVSRTSAASALARAQRDPGPSARIAKLHIRFRNSASCGPWVPALRSHTLASAGTRELLASSQAHHVEQRVPHGANSYPPIDRPRRPQPGRAGQPPQLQLQLRRRRLVIDPRPRAVVVLEEADLIHLVARDRRPT